MQINNKLKYKYIYNNKISNFKYILFYLFYRISN